MPRGVTLGPRFRDGLGVRVVEVEKTNGDAVEVLYLCPDLCPFEKAIKARSDRLSSFRHPRFVPVRGVRAASGPHGRIGVIADHIVGPRLSEVLEAARHEKIAVDTNAALHLIRELLSAIAAFHESRKVTHGAIGPERLIVTPRGRLMIVDYTLGPGLERLQYNRARLWRDLRIAMPPTAGAAGFDQRADVNQIGTVAVALMIGRPLDTSDYPGRLPELLDGVGEVTVNGDRKPLSPALRSWLERALPLEPRKPFGTARQANVALEQILIKERRPGVAPAALRAFIARYLSSTAESATEAHEAATDQLVQSAAETRAGDEGDESAPLPETRDAPASGQRAASSASDSRTSPARDAAPAPSAGPGRDVPSFTSAVVEADPESAGPFAATPFEIVPDAAPTPSPEVGSEIISEVSPETTPGSSARAASGIAAAISSDITVEVTSGIDAEFTVEIASGIVEATTVEKPLEVGSGGGPDIATADAEEAWAPARDAVGPSLEIPGIAGFDADPGRILAVETELGVAPKLPETTAAAAGTLAELRMPSPRTAAVSLPVRDETPSRPGEQPPSPREELHERGPAHRKPAAAAASDDVWVIDPSDLTFDPAFLDGLYQPLRANLGPLIAEPPGKVGAEPAVKPLPPAVAHPHVPPVRREGEDVLPGEPPTAEARMSGGDAQPAPSPAPVAGTPLFDTTSFPEVAPIAAAEEAVAVAEPAAGVADEAPVAEAVAAPAAEAVSAPVALPADVIVAGVITEVAAQAGAEAATEVTTEAVTEVAAGPMAEPIAEAVAPEEPPDVPEPSAAAASPAVSAAPVLEPLEVLPALDASWPFVQESPTPVDDLVAKLAPGAELTSVDADVRRVARLPSASLRPGRPRPTIGGSASAQRSSGSRSVESRPAGSATSPATTQAAALAEAPSVVVPTAASPAAPVEAVPAPVTARVAAPVVDAAGKVPDAVVESVAESAGKASAPERPRDVAAPLGEAVPPPASVTPELAPLEVLPALDADWPFVQESPDPAADLLVKLASKSPAAPAAARAAAAEPAPVGPPPDATPVAESAAEPTATPVTEWVPLAAATAVAEPVAEPIAEAVSELTAGPIVETTMPRRPTGVTAPSPGEEPSPAGLASDTPAVASPHAATTAQEGSGAQEAVKVFERLLESLQDTLAAQTVTVLPEASDAPSGVAAETPAGTMALAAAPDESACDRASLHDQVSVAPHVPIFEAPRVSGGPAVPSPPEEAPPPPAPSRPLMFSVRETAARLARSVPTRLVDLGRRRLRWRQAAAAAFVMVALGGVRLATAYWFKAPPPTGDLIVETVPDGLQVFVDNVLRGQTPMSVTLPAGDHVLEVRGKGLTRTLPVRIAPAVKAEERLSWPLSARTGRLRVESEPSKASVSVDGQPRGVTPLTIEDLPARVHTLVVQGRGGRIERSVTIDPEQTTTVKVPVFPGWMKVFSPFDLQIFEGGRLLANTDVDRVMLRAGRHTIEFVSEELGYRVVRQVDITPGAVAPVSMEPANGTLEIDAPPGFEVWLDGERVGETPLAALQVSLGTHDVRLKHPQSGERRRTVVVTQREPARVTAEGK